jgi:hypothetical protein
MPFGGTFRGDYGPTVRERRQQATVYRSRAGREALHARNEATASLIREKQARGELPLGVRARAERGETVVSAYRPGQGTLRLGRHSYAPTRKVDRAVPILPPREHPPEIPASVTPTRRHASLGLAPELDLLRHVFLPRATGVGETMRARALAHRPALAEGAPPRGERVRMQAVLRDAFRDSWTLNPNVEVPSWVAVGDAFRRAARSLGWDRKGAA